MKQLTLTLLLFFSCLNISRAGLVVEIDPTIPTKNIQQIDIEEGNLIIHYSNNKKIIKLPEEVLASIILWASQNAVGPLVFSYDHTIMRGAEEYASASVPEGLSYAMLRYDAYAHLLIGGGIPHNEQSHPFVIKNDHLMPDKQFKELMDLNNQSPNALRYQHAMFRHISKPSCVGEFTIKALASNKQYPIKIEVESFRTLRSQKWYRSTDVFSPQDREIFSLPYLPLKKDMEGRWDEYRKAFTPMEELSSIVEAYGLLSAIRKNNISLWKKIVKKSFSDNDSNIIPTSINSSSRPSLNSKYWKIDYSWEKQCVEILGKKIETIEEAEVAIALKWKEGNQLYNYAWDEQLYELATKNKDIHAKLLLLNINENLYEDKILAREYIDEFFELTHNSNELFRIRIRGIKLLKRYVSYASYDDNYNELFESMYFKELELLLNDFIHIVNEASDSDSNKKSSEIDLDKWEDLSQDVYSTGLLNLASYFYDDRLKPDFVQAIASIHFNRGRAFQKGRGFAYRHAHFRFLKYLLNNCREEKKISLLINGYRAELARMMKITEWDEGKVRFQYTDDKEYLNDKAYTADNNWLNSLSQLNGKLIAVSSLLTKDYSPELSYKALNKGKPGGILNDQNQFTTLLMNGKILSQLISITNHKNNSIKVYGIPYDNNKCLKPIKIIYLSEEGKWLVFDFTDPTLIN